ncbi:MAG: hypothetical protein NFCOHLIN_00703 [Gammaproteobacteria bacterium]|nr:hypothetical protein [Gammaproteobacteria bacterium]
MNHPRHARALASCLLPVLLFWHHAAARAGAAVVDRCPPVVDSPTSAREAVVPAIPYGEGLLFRVERPGEAPSHVFGTIHLDDPRLHRPPTPVNLALLQGSRLVLETLIDGPAQAAYTRRMNLPADRSLADWMGGEVLARYERLARHYAVPVEQALALKAWAATGLVGRPRPASGRTMEDVLRETALRMGRPVYGLETIEELIAAQEEQPVEEQVTVLVDTVCNHARIMADTVWLIELYGRGDLAAIVHQNEIGHESDPLFQRMNERMLYARSEQMVARMREHLRAGGALIAVGALHLPGERGILRLLEKRGYTITRVF